MDSLNHILRFLAAVACLGCFLGCPSSTPEETDDQIDRPTAISTAFVRLLLVDAPELEKPIRREWTARDGGTPKLFTATTAELLDGTAPEADAIIYPAPLMGTLAEKEVITAIPRDALNNRSYRFEDLSTLTRLREVRWGRETMTVPLGSARFVLFYRKDLIAEIGEQAPQTWEQYEAICEKLAAAHPDRTPALEPLATGWASQLLLARGVAYAHRYGNYSTFFNMRNIDPLINTPPLERALKELDVVAKLRTEDQQHLSTPEQVRQQFLMGKTAMAITWPVAADFKEMSIDPTTIGIVSLPGSTEVYDSKQWRPRTDKEGTQIPLLGVSGLAGSVSMSARRSDAAAALLMWLASREQSVRISPHSSQTTMFRNSHFDKPEKWVSKTLGRSAAREYASALKAEQSQTAAVFSPRLPLREQYLQALDQAVLAALQGDASPKDALAEAAEQWEAISKRRGQSEQIDAYRHSLGLN